MVLFQSFILIINQKFDGQTDKRKVFPMHMQMTPKITTCALDSIMDVRGVTPEYYIKKDSKLSSPFLMLTVMSNMLVL